MEQKKCSKCKEWKDLDCFGKCKRNKDGLQYKCKECIKEYSIIHKDKISKYKKDYAINHKEKISEYQKDYDMMHKSEKAEYDKNYRENHKKELTEYNIKNKEKISKRNKEYKKKNKSKVLKQSKEYKNSPIEFNSKTKYRQQIEVYEEEIRESADGYLQCKCAYCGDWFTPTYQNIYHRISAINKIGIGEKRLYCSDPCKKACPTYNQTLYPKGFKSATSREVQPELRQMVLARDNYTCQRCGKHKEELSEECIALHCHHLEGIHWEPLMSADIDMCITYCQPCHVKAHQTPDCSYHDQQCA